MPTESDDAVEVLFDETRLFPPAESFRRQANVNDDQLYRAAEADRLAFWEGCARQLCWQAPWQKTLDWQPPYAKWFVEGKLNACDNCVDRHLETGVRNKAALIWEGEPGEQRTLTYEELHREVSQLANVLKNLGIRKGDRVAIYLPMIPEAVVSLLACARIGAIHTVVFGGFSADALKDRMQDAQAKLLITADGGYRRGKIIALKATADAALAHCPTIENVLVVRRSGTDVPMTLRRDHWYHDLVNGASVQCPCEPMEANDTLYILYTSGTTGKPKGIMHSTGGYLVGVHVTTKWVFDLKPTDVYWCTADVGWVTGHSYVVYGPLSNGATQVIYEGAPDWPQCDRFWQIIQKHGVTLLYTTPTAIRTFMKWGVEWPQKWDLTSLRLLATVGEPINPEAWIWYFTHIGGSRCPVVDTWWQTETGCIVIAPLPGITTLKPGSATRPLPGMQATVLTAHGVEVATGGGYLALTAPWPAMLQGIYGDPQRYVSTYWSRWNASTYFTGDGAKRDADGYFWLLGRVDDVMNIAGHRLGSMELESALVDHQAVAEAAVVGVTDAVKGQAIVAFVTVKAGISTDPALERTLSDHVVSKVGGIARPQRIIFTPELPKTRSGKIMRRLLRDLAEGRHLGDVTTLADVSVMSVLKQRYDDI
jgi:acetyl-CoA synthetase